MYKIFAGLFCLFLTLLISLHPMDVPSVTDEKLFNYLQCADMGNGNIAQRPGNPSIAGTVLDTSAPVSCWYARAFLTPGLPMQQADFDNIKYFFSALRPFTFWVDASNHAVIEEAKKQGLTYLESEYMMRLDLTQQYEKGSVENMSVQEFQFNRTSLVKRWIATSAGDQAFGIDEDSVMLFMNYVHRNGDEEYIWLYTAYISDTPVATCFTVWHKETSVVTLHQVSTIEKYRHRGISENMIKHALNNAFEEGYK